MPFNWRQLLRDSTPRLNQLSALSRHRWRTRANRLLPLFHHLVAPLFWLLGPLLLLEILWLGSGSLKAQDCLGCHSIEGLNSERPALTIAQEDFEKSVHGSLGCSICHTNVKDFPHGTVEKVSCAACHSEQVSEYDSSIHGRAKANGDGDVPTCQGCHGPIHALQPVSNPNSPVYHLNLPATCGKCHGNPELARKHGIPITNAYQLYMDSIHGRAVARSGLLVAANCSSCHGSHEIQPKKEPESKVNRKNIAATCGACHAGILAGYFQGVHGRAMQAGNLKAPVCSDCHTAHQITRVDSEPWQLDLIRECGTCHEESIRTYRDTLHGQITALGFTRVARCADCHGSHEILAAADPQSSVSPANRVKTCQKCHPQATASFARFSPHADSRNRERNPGLYYAARLMNALMIGVFGFFGLHTILWLARSLRERSQRGKPKPPEEEVWIQPPKEGR
jgi:hypothetical protein